MESFPFVGQDLVKKHLNYSQLFPAINGAFQEYTRTKAEQPLRTTVAIPKSNGTFLTMPSYSSTNNILMTKLLGMYPDNTKVKLPTHLCYITVFDPDTGLLRCLMDGEIITLMRTAAASVVATQVILEGTPKVLAVLGCGLQARSHIAAFSEAYDLEKIKVWGRTAEKAQNLCREFDQLPMESCNTVEDAVKDADIVVTVTHATQPILFGKWLKKGSHVNCVGACRPSWRECDDDCMKNATVYTDSKESALHESGDVIMSKVEVYAEVGEILLGEKPLQSGRHHTFFKSLGFALEDAVAAKLVWDGVQNEVDKTSK